jgi:hypothetical protein
MTKLKLFSAAVILAGLALAPRYHHRYHQHVLPYGLPYEISYLHNYGPGLVPGTFAYYDGPATNACYQSAAAYRGQDGRRHPCF